MRRADGVTDRGGCSSPIVFITGYLVDPDGKFRGTFRNFGLNFPASTCGDVVHPVTVWIDGDRVSFTILRKDPRGCGAVQAWAGYVRGNQLFVQFADVLWNGTEHTARSGYDRYQKQ